MRIIKFKEQNANFAKNQEQYKLLPSHITNDERGIVTSCWEPSLKERFKLLFGGKLWLRIMTFNHPLQPQLLSIEKPEME